MTEEQVLHNLRLGGYSTGKKNDDLTLSWINEDKLQQDLYCIVSLPVYVF